VRKIYFSEAKKITIESAIYTSRNEEAVEVYIKAFGLSKGYTAHSADGKLVYSKLMNGDEHFISLRSLIC